MDVQLLPKDDEARLDRMVSGYGPDSVLASLSHICDVFASEHREDNCSARAEAWEDLSYQIQLVIARKAGKL